MGQKLKDKVAMITGGNSGIGLATAKPFAAEGARVAITGRNGIIIQSSLKEIGNGTIGVVSDVSDLRSLQPAFEKVKNEFGKIDVLVVNAGVLLTGLMECVTEDMFDQVIDVN